MGGREGEGQAELSPLSKTLKPLQDLFRSLAEYSPLMVSASFDLHLASISSLYQLRSLPTRAS